MGPEVKPRNRSGHTRDVNQDGPQLSRLQEELNRCNMKIAQLQARLVSTLDELDSHRHQHRQELKTERRTREKLSNKLDAYLEEVKRAERERDDMRELVNVLLEKVQACHTYATWPCPRMDLASPLAPLLRLDDLEDPEAIATSDNPLHGTIMVALLQRRLAEEQRAHALTKQEADAEILRLKAMIARRDAELEACAAHDGHQVLLSTIQSHAPEARIRCVPGVKGCGEHTSNSRAHDAVPGSPHDTDLILTSTATRNRALEREVEFLRHQIHQAQQHKRHTHIASDRAARQSSAKVEKRDVAVQVQITEDSEHRSSPRPTSPGLLPYTMPSSPSPYNLSPTHGWGPAQPRSVRPKPSLGAHDPITAPEYDVQTLETDIDCLSAQIDAFIQERKALKSLLARDIRAPSPAGILFERSSHPDGAEVSAHLEQCPSTCLRDLRERLDSMARERGLQERRLEEEIRGLWQTIRELLDGHIMQPPPHHVDGADHPRYAPISGDTQVPSKHMSPRVSPTLVPDDAAALRAANGLDEGPRDQYPRDLHRQPNSHSEVPQFSAADEDEFGELSMELATPVQRTLQSLREEDWSTPLTNHAIEFLQLEPAANPADIPLPVSPDGQASTCPPSSSPSSSNLLPQPEELSPPLYIAPPRVPSVDLLARIESITEQRVASLERQIAVTHRHLENKEAALADLRVTAAQLEAPLQPRENADGVDAGRV